MRDRSPLAYQALSHSLAELSGGQLSPIAFDIEFIIGPLRRAFQHRTLNESLGDLVVLATRFDATYITLERIDWSTGFKTDLTRFKKLIDNITVKELAIQETQSDQHNFNLLCPAGFIRQDRILIHLDNQSNAITEDLREICIAHPLLMRRLRELAKVNEL